MDAGYLKKILDLNDIDNLLYISGSAPNMFYCCRMFPESVNVNIEHSVFSYKDKVNNRQYFWDTDDIVSISGKPNYKIKLP